MRIGTICYAVERGIGILAKDFYDNGVVTDVVVVSHGALPNCAWYPDAPILYRKPFLCEAVKRLIARVDVMLFFETPFDWHIIQYCERVGCKTVIMPMHECMLRSFPYPDQFICPSLIERDQYHGDFIPVPVPGKVKWEQRTTAKRFLHNAGHMSFRDRNGTVDLMRAMEYVHSPIELMIRAQSDEIQDAINQVPSIKDDSRVTFEYGTIPYEDLFTGYDVFVFTEKFNGLSMPLQEARATGMLVIATDRYPINTWLPQPLVPVHSYSIQKLHPRGARYEEASVDPGAIARVIDDAYESDIKNYSISGKLWARETSWKTLKPRYMEALTS